MRRVGGGLYRAGECVRIPRTAPFCGVKMTGPISVNDEHKF